MRDEGCIQGAVSTIGEHGREEFVPTLRAMLRDASPSLAAMEGMRGSEGSSGAQAIAWALRDLGDIDFLEQLYGPEVESVIASLAGSSEIGEWTSAAERDLALLSKAGLDDRLAARRPINGRALSDHVPLRLIHAYAPPIQLGQGEELRVLLRKTLPPPWRR